MTMNRQPTLWESERKTLQDSIELTAQSLLSFATAYDHWSIAYSGGKDSTALLCVVIYLIKTGRVPRPKSLIVLRSDTRMELPPLDVTARKIMDEVEAMGFEAKTVLPALDDRFFVYILGRGVPPPSNTFRWCTGQIKVEPMVEALKSLRDAYGKKFLMLTGVRIGESAARDARIALSCGKNNSECGQGWLQVETPDAVADTLAPLLHWRLCHVWDWLNFFEDEHGFSTHFVASVYGQDEDLETHARTGCIQCNLASRDLALENIIRRPEWRKYEPLVQLKPLYARLKLPHYRLRKDGGETRKDGSLVKNPCRMGPLTFQARLMGLNEVKRIQKEAHVDLINQEEEARILELIEAKTWPNGWDGTEPLASNPFENVFADGSKQANLLQVAGTVPNVTK